MFDAPGVLWVAIMVAVGVGALHALAPGHGKSIAAAYLVGARGRYRDAAMLGTIVAVMHTVSVMILALGWVALSAVTTVGTEAFTAWLQVVAAAVAIVVGVGLVRRWLAAQRQGRHDLVAAPQEHTHEHSHHGRRHHHGPVDGVAPWSRGGLLALGLSGGLLPSPSAFLVLSGGLLTGRVVYAAALVAAFGIGMAATLTVVGAATVGGNTLISRTATRWSGLNAITRRLPLAAACGVLLGGFLYLAVAAMAVAAA